MDVVTKIAKAPTGSGGPFRSDVPREAVVIESMSVVAAR
jgi:peptidyl-prolyl cis-trans isomerase A (cyclophilin A)/peptidyl-prolyl cis-trans isomerase B (cyclophilin B)